MIPMTIRNKDTFYLASFSFYLLLLIITDGWMRNTWFQWGWFYFYESNFPDFEYFSEFCPKKSLGVGFRFFHLIELANDIEASCTFGQYWMIVPADHILLNSFPMWKWKMVKYQINCFSCCCKFCAKGHCPTSLKLDCKFYLGLTIYLYRITKKCTGIMNKS